MKTALAIAPPPSARRHRTLSLEPVVFSLLLMLLTTGINLGAAAALQSAAAVHAQALLP